MYLRNLTAKQAWLPGRRLAWASSYPELVQRKAGDKNGAWDPDFRWELKFPMPPLEKSVNAKEKGKPDLKRRSFISRHNYDAFTSAQM